MSISETDYVKKIKKFGQEVYNELDTILDSKSCDLNTKHYIGFKLSLKIVILGFILYLCILLKLEILLLILPILLVYDWRYYKKELNLVCRLREDIQIRHLSHNLKVFPRDLIAKMFLPVVLIFILFLTTKFLIFLNINPLVPTISLGTFCMHLGIITNILVTIFVVITSLKNAIDMYGYGEIVSYLSNSKTRIMSMSLILVSYVITNTLTLCLTLPINITNLIFTVDYYLNEQRLDSFRVCG